MKKNNLFMLIFVVLIFTGCWDKIELEDRGFVISIAIDKYDNSDIQKDKKNNENNNKNEKDDNSGEDSKNTMDTKPSDFTGNDDLKRYVVTMAIPNISEIASGGNGEGDGSAKAKSIKKSSGTTVSDAMRIIDTYSSQKLYYGHTKVCVLGEEVMKDPVLFSEAIDALERNKEISRKLIILGTKGKAEEILNAKPAGEPLIGMFISDFYKNNIKNISVTFRQDLESIIQQFLSSKGTVIPEVSIENEEIKIGGLGVVKDYKLLGWLDDIQTRGYMWTNDDKIGGSINAEMENAFVPFRITNKETDLTFEQTNEELICNINISVDGNIEEFKLSENILLDSDRYKKLQSEYEKIIEKEVMETINTLQNKYNVDAFGFSELCRKNYYDIYLKYKDNWNDIFSKIKFVPNVNVCIRGSGTTK